jgi:hypothetical protein
VKCEELSPRGFTYLLDEQPDYDTVLLALGDERDRAFTSATVKHCRNIGSDGAPVFRVTCEFVVPVDRFADAVAS